MASGPKSEIRFAPLFPLLACLVFQQPLHSQTEPSWAQLPAGPTRPTNSRHDDVFFVNAKTGWVVNGTGDIHKTTDGGSSWTLQANLGTYLRCTEFIDTLHGFVGSLYGLLFETTDGGSSWNPKVINGPSPSGLCGMWVVDSQVVYISGKYSGPAVFVKTTDGGATWNSSSVTSVAGGLVDCYFTSRLNGFVVGFKDSTYANGLARILATTDGGATWQTRYAGTRRGELCWKISFPSDSIGYVSIENFNHDSVACLKTTDAGMTWAKKFIHGGPGVPPPVEAQGIGFATDLHGWVGGWESVNVTYETTDGGTSWSQVVFGKNINRFRFLSDTLGFAVGVGVYRYGRELVTTVETPLQGPPGSFEVLRAFPNPFNPETVIEYSVPHSSTISLIIIDQLGRTVATLVDEFQSAGVRRVTWDASRNASGVYFCLLKSRELREIRKLILVK